jgi:acetoin utilization deacetylase AcuC-like enzyme
MIILTPPRPVLGAPNLSKGQKVFDVVFNANGDTAVTLDLIEEPILTETVEQLKTIHDPEYVSGVWGCSESNGYGAVGDLAFDSNVHSVHSCAIMKEATRLAVENPLAPVFAPVSGFHHAGWNYGGGYCTFNGLILAATTVQLKNPKAKILIVDGDGHFGDGTQDIIDHCDLPLIYHCSLSKYSVGGDSLMANRVLLSSLRDKAWDLIIYQAGADSHRDDPYGSGYLTDAEWRLRDELVFTHCCCNEVPLVFDLAGGYNGPKTILLHSDTVTTARKIYGEQPRAHL